MKWLRIPCILLFVCSLTNPALAGDREVDAVAIEAAVRNYIEGWFTSDPARMRQSLHPNLLKATVRTMQESGTEYLDIIETESLVAYAAHNQQWVAGKELKELHIVYQDEHIAVVHAVSTDFYDVCGLIKVEGEWKILQVLWAPTDVDNN